jgi:UDP-N-acetylmuramoylalanine--D-glutamate ligase
MESIADHGGILWVDDSASTTPSATQAALAVFDRPAVVILGGISKGADFAPLAADVVRRARAAVLIGPAADEIGAALAAAGAKPSQIRPVASLTEAVEAARALARPGDVVLLSPAAMAREDYAERTADHFSSADERGDRFVALVRSMFEGPPA